MTTSSDLNTVAVDLAEAALLADVRVAATVEQSAARIEDQAKEWAPRKRLPYYARTVTHDVTVEPGAVVAEIGPDKDINGQAGLAHIFEYGTATLAPRAHLGPALDRESPAFVSRLEDVAGDIL